MDDKFLMRFIIVCGVFVSSTIALIIICTVAYQVIIQPEAGVPDVLRDWGGLILGFYFGSFIGLIKDWFGIKKMPTQRNGSEE